MRTARTPIIIHTISRLVAYIGALGTAVCAVPVLAHYAVRLLLPLRHGRWVVGGLFAGAAAHGCGRSVLALGGCCEVIRRWWVQLRGTVKLEKRKGFPGYSVLCEYVHVDCVVEFFDVDKVLCCVGIVESLRNDVKSYTLNIATSPTLYTLTQAPRLIPIV